MAQQDSSNQSERNRFVGYLQFVVIIGLIIVAVIFARAPERFGHAAVSSQNVDAPPPVVNVIKQTKKADFEIPIRLTGNVGINERVAISPEARGRVAWVSENFKAGRTIAANEVFLRIDPTEYQLRVKEAETLLALQQLKTPVTEQDAEVSMEEFNTHIELLELRLELAKRDLAQTNISLPYSFRVIRSDIEVGELVGPFEYAGADSSILGTGYRPESVQVQAPIELDSLDNLDSVIGRAATIKVRGTSFPAELERVSNVVSPETRMIQLVFRFTDDTPIETLPLPGLFAEIDLDGPTYENAVAIPYSAMQAGDTVQVVEDGILNVRSLTTLELTDEYWIVQDFDVADGLVVGSPLGLSAGMKVVANYLD